MIIHGNNLLTQEVWCQVSSGLEIVREGPVGAGCCEAHEIVWLLMLDF
jgi:hypothetical protein